MTRRRQFLRIVIQRNVRFLDPNCVTHTSFCDLRHVTSSYWRIDDRPASAQIDPFMSLKIDGSHSNDFKTCIFDICSDPNLVLY